MRELREFLTAGGGKSAGAKAPGKTRGRNPASPASASRAGRPPRGSVPRFVERVLLAHPGWTAREIAGQAASGTERSIPPLDSIRVELRKGRASGRYALEGIRPIKLTAKNALFAGHDEGVTAWGSIASLIGTCKMNGVEPYAWLKSTLEKIARGNPQSKIRELMPWNFEPEAHATWSRRSARSPYNLIDQPRPRRGAQTPLLLYFSFCTQPFAPVECLQGEVDHEFVRRAVRSPGGVFDALPLLGEYADAPVLCSIGCFGHVSVSIPFGFLTQTNPFSGGFPQGKGDVSGENLPRSRPWRDRSEGVARQLEMPVGRSGLAQIATMQAIAYTARKHGPCAVL